MATPKKKGKPVWLATLTEDDVESKHYKRSIRYYTRLYAAWPAWADEDAMWALYQEAARRRASGEEVQVDHMVPISSPWVCGLHCEANLQIIDELGNLQKGNHWWPDMWNEQQTLAGLEALPLQASHCPKIRRSASKPACHASAIKKQAQLF